MGFEGLGFYVLGVLYARMDLRAIGGLIDLVDGGIELIHYRKPDPWGMC